MRSVNSSPVQATAFAAEAAVAPVRADAVAPSSRIADWWRAPVHDLPLRNEILFENLAFAPDMRVLEVGPGAGYTAFLLARTVSELAVIDISDQHLRDLERALQPAERLRLLRGDFSQDCSDLGVNGCFDCAFALDVLEYVVKPHEFFSNMARMLRPGGQLLVTFPNFTPPEGDGATWFTTQAELREVVASAGFASVRLCAVRPNRYVEFLYQVCHQLPLRLLRRRRWGGPEVNPQTYDRTWAFQNRRRLAAMKVALHAYWAAVLWAMRRFRPVFTKAPLGDEILRKQILILAER